MLYPRILIAGVSSGVGKTTLTLGILAALKRKGLQVQPFKVGPDYIDPGIHFYAAGRPSHNLDSWMGNDEVVKNIFCRQAQSAHISVIEGVMGLYDGAKDENISGSSAHIALILDVPVILVVNVKGMGNSCIALVKGYMEYEPSLSIRGVILNNAGSEYYRSYISRELEKKLGVKVMGCLPRQPGITIPERHLGLLPAEENTDLERAILKMADLIEDHINLEDIIHMAYTAGEIPYSLPPAEEPIYRCIIAVARDEAFSFYYQDNLDYLREQGARLVFFSPLRDRVIPAADGIYIGGGFPEMFLERLSSNRSMMQSLKDAYSRSIPILAECGGYMYLAQTIRDFQGKSWPGAALIPVEVEMKNNLMALGYVRARSLIKTIVSDPGDIIKGHEFHYSEVKYLQNGGEPFSLSGGKGLSGRLDGYARGSLLASYVHLHFRSNPELVAKYLLSILGTRAFDRRID